MKQKTHIIKTVYGGWAIVYYLDNGFPVPCDRVIYPFKWMARFRKWIIEDVHGNYFWN
jgi:hypothetical protein